MMPPKLSIITINYNNAPGLLKTMKSVLSQTSNDLEYIVIDGGSTDGSKEIILEFADQQINSSTNRKLTWVSEPDRGIYHAMNKGIQQSKGEYCQFLNSGDWLVEHDVTEKMLNALPDCSIFYGNMLKVFPNGKILRDTCGAGNLTMLSFYLGGMNHSPTYIKRELFEKYGLYDENYKIVSDWKWYMNAICLNNESLKYINLDVAYFDMKGISNMNPILNKSERRQVLEEMLPIKILEDFDKYWLEIIKLKRINNYKLTKWLFWSFDRILLSCEKIKKL